MAWMSCMPLLHGATSKRNDVLHWPCKSCEIMRDHTSLVTHIHTSRCAHNFDELHATFVKPLLFRVAGCRLQMPQLLTFLVHAHLHARRTWMSCMPHLWSRCLAEWQSSRVTASLWTAWGAPWMTGCVELLIDMKYFIDILTNYVWIAWGTPWMTGCVGGSWLDDH